MVVGLTGKYCAGKDTVARAFSAEGWSVIDVDWLGHEALETRAREVIDAFGPGVQRAPGVVDRKALGRIVFTDPDARRRLERIVHPLMAERARQDIARRGGNVVLNAAVLHRMGLDRDCGAVVFVTSPWILRLARAMRRDRLSLREALARLSAQQDIQPQRNAAAVDTYTVHNRGGRRSLEARAAVLARRLRG